MTGQNDVSGVDLIDPVSTYLANYEFRGDQGDYTPSCNERELLEDALNGFLTEFCDPLLAEMKMAELAFRRVARDPGTSKAMREIAIARAGYAAALTQARGSDQ